MVCLITAKQILDNILGTQSFVIVLAATIVIFFDSLIEGLKNFLFAEQKILFINRIEIYSSISYR